MASRPSLLTIDDVAAFLRVSPSTVRRLVDRGELRPPIHVGRSIRWRETDLRSWI